MSANTTLLTSASDFLVSISLLLVRKSDFLVSISLLLVRKSDFLVSILLLLVSKSDFLVADELAAFEIHNPADLSRTNAVDGSKVSLFVFSRLVQISNLLDRAHGQFSIHG